MKRLGWFSGEIYVSVEFRIGVLEDGRAMENKGGIEFVFEEAVETFFCLVEVFGVDGGGNMEFPCWETALVGARDRIPHDGDASVGFDVGVMIVTMTGGVYRCEGSDGVSV